MISFQTYNPAFIRCIAPQSLFFMLLTISYIFLITQLYLLWSLSISPKSLTQLITNCFWQNFIIMAFQNWLFLLFAPFFLVAPKVICNPFPTFSSSRIVSSGILRGSVLDLLLFSIFTADLFSLDAQLYMYADYVLLVKSFISLDAASVSPTLNHNLQLIADWSASCGLLLNPTKSFSLLVGSSVLLSRSQSFSVSLNSVPLVTPSLARITGLHVDSFEHHVTSKCRAAFARLRLHFLLRRILSVF